MGEETAPRSRLIPVNVYFSLMLAVYFLSLVLLGFISHFLYFRGETERLIIIALSVVIVVVSLVVSLHCIYRMWSAVQDGKVTTSPGLAVGLLFVPIFNFYWIFKVFYGFARNYNALAKRHNLNIPPLPSGLYLVQIILGFVAGISSYLTSDNLSVQVSAAFLLIPLSLATFYLTCQAVNRIPAEIYRHP